MNLTTHYSIGSVVITHADGAYQKTTITGIRIYVREDLPDPSITYEFNVNGMSGSSSQTQLEANYLLYKEAGDALTDEQSKLSQAARDRLIFWNMKLDKPQKGKEIQENGNRTTTDKPKQIAQTLPLYGTAESKDPS